MRFFILICVLFITCRDASSDTLLDRLEASVNADLILLSDVRAFRKNIGLRSQLDPLFAGTVVASKGDSAPAAEIVTFLIDEKIISQAFPVSDGEVEQEINSIQANNRIDRSSLMAALKQQGFTFQDYFDLIRSSVSKRALIDRDIRTKVYISDDDVKNYFYNHYPAENRSGTSYKIQMITISPKNYKSSSAAKEIIQRARNSLLAGESFAEVAERFSDDPSAPAGGDLGFMSLEEMSPAIREEVKKLRVGQVSDILGSDQTAYFFIKLADLRSGQESKLKSLSEEIRNKLTAEEYQHQITLWLDKERQKAFIHRASE